MTFVYSTEVDLSLDNGAGINEREFVESLIRYHGEDIVCVIPYPKNPDRYFRDEIEYVFAHHSSGLRYPLFLLSQFRRLLRVNRTRNITAFAFRLGEIPIVVLAISWITRKPLILKTLAGYYLFEKEDRPLVQKAYSLVARLFYRRAIQRTALADTVSHAYVDWLEHNFAIDREKVFLIQNGANTDFFTPLDKVKARKSATLEEYDKIIGYVGALDRLRHIDKLIEAVGKVEYDGKVGLILIGNNKNLEYLEPALQQKTAKERTRFLGFVPYKDIPTYMNALDVAADFSLIPMKVDGEYVNASYSQKIPQYLSCGVPVVTWDTRDTKFIEENGVGEIVEYGDTDTLARVLEQMLHQEDKYDQSAIREYALNSWSTKVLASKRLNAWKNRLDATKN